MSDIEFNGTGGIIEGNLGAANVNVNLDSTVEFSGDDYITVPSASDLNFGTNDFSISMWVKFEAGAISTAEQHLINRGQAGLANSFTLRCNSAENLFFRFSNLSNSGNYDLDPSNLGSWTHIAITFDRSANAVLYINGVSKITQDISSVSSNAISNAQWLIGGENSASPANLFKGNVADVKFFGDLLTETEIKQLASKINVDSDTFGIDNRKAWYKINEGSGQTITDHDDSGTDYDATMTNGTWIYDEYSVDVYDNSTTTDGTFTVTQGKVECKALSSANFDGSDDYIAIGNYETTMRASHTWSLWFKVTDGDPGAGQMLIGTTDASTNEAMLMNIGSSGNSLAFGYITGGTSEDTVVSSVLNDGQNPWRLFTVAVTVIDSNSVRYNMFLDGAQIGDETHTGIDLTALNLSTNIDIGAWNFGGFAHLLDYTGLIRDVRLYDYALSDEQMASLYSNTYPQTPKHHWMLDEGTGTTATDSGTSTSNGTYNGATHNNGTLDLDFDLVIYANGTLSAPRGEISLVRNFQNSGVYTHNNGTFSAVAGDNTFINTTGTVDPVFYNVRLYAQQLRFYQSTTIERQLQLDSTATHCYIWANKTLTMGSATNPETGYPKLKNNLNTGDKQFWFYAGDGETATLQGVSELYPIIYTNTNGSSIEWGYHANGVAQIKNIDFQFDITTDTSTTNNIKLTGDCEFDAFTVSSGDTLDFNGQRAEFGALFKNSGTIDCDGALIYGNQVNIDGSTTNTSNAVIINNTAGFNDFSDGQWKWMGTNLGAGSATESGTFTNTAAKRVCMSGIIAPNDNTTVGDMVIATGATYTAGSHTTTVAGDFTISGGLIGKSGLNFDGSNDYVTCGSHSSIDDIFDNGGTAEFWIKPESDGEGNFGRILDKNQWILNLRDELSGFVRLNFTHSFSTTDGTWKTTDRVIPLNKWSHVAITYDGSSVSNDPIIYVDGKSVLLTDGSTPAGSYSSDSSSDLIIGNKSDGSRTFEGVIDMARIFDDVRTQSEIRADMFNEHANMANTGNLVGMWQFDEGTGTTVDNVANSGVAAGSLVNSPAWAGAGTLSSVSTSTFTMSGSNKFINYNGGNLDIGSLNVTGTITLKDLDGGGSSLRITGNTFTCGSGATLSSDSSEKLRFMNGMDAGTLTFADPATNVVGLSAVLNEMNTPRSLNIPEVTMFYFRQNGTGTTVATGNHTFTSELEINNGTYNANGKIITSKLVDINGTGTFTLGASGLVLNNTSGGLTSESGVTLNAGPGCTIGGDASGQKVSFESQNGFQIVGDIDDLNVTNEELTVVGTVTNCTGDILQFTPGHDTTLSLETDTAEDRDIRLGGPSLDNANHLIAE